VLTCEPADPASKGGVEAAVKISKADLVPTDTNLRPGGVRVPFNIESASQVPRSVQIGLCRRRCRQPALRVQNRMRELARSEGRSSSEGLSWSASAIIRRP
jgi:hypothetical protein